MDRSNLKSIQRLSEKLSNSIPKNSNELTKFPLFGSYLLGLNELFRLVEQLSPAVKAKVCDIFSSPFADANGRQKILSSPEKYKQELATLGLEFQRMIPLFQQIYSGLPVVDQVEE